MTKQRNCPCLVSFDVTSLSTQVPVDVALEVVEARLTKDPTLVDRTVIPVSQLVECIEMFDNLFPVPQQII